MAYRLRHVESGAEINVTSRRRRDRFLRRGFVPAGEPVPTERSYRDVQNEAKSLGIPANQTRADLERAIAAHKR